MKKLLLLLVSILIMGTLGGCSGEFPSKTVTLLVGWGAGGGTDLTARAFAASLEEELGQTVVVQNLTGASGAVAMESFLSESPDGYTLLFSADTIATFQTMGLGDYSVDDVRPLMMISDDPKLITVAGSSDIDSFAELTEQIEANPGEYRLAYSGPGASGHIQALMLKSAGLDLNASPLGGGTAQILAVMNGQSDFTSPSGSTVTEYLKSGDLKALCVFDDEAVAGYDDLPPITDALPDMAKFMPISFPVSLHAHKDTDDETYGFLLEACKNAAADDDFQAFLSDGLLRDLTDITEQDAADYIKRLSSVYSWLLYDEGVAEHSPDDFGIPRAD